MLNFFAINMYYPFKAEKEKRNERKYQTKNNFNKYF